MQNVMIKKTNIKKYQRINTAHLSCATVKQHITELLANSSQCQTILECMNQDTGEYRIVLQGILEKNYKRK